MDRITDCNRALQFFNRVFIRCAQIGGRYSAAIMKPQYRISIELHDGQRIVATVTKATLRGLKMSACKSITWRKI